MCHVLLFWGNTEIKSEFQSPCIYLFCMWSAALLSVLTHSNYVLARCSVVSVLWVFFFLLLIYYFPPLSSGNGPLFIFIFPLELKWCHCWLVIALKINPLGKTTTTTTTTYIYIYMNDTCQCLMLSVKNILVRKKIEDYWWIVFEE